MNKFSNIIIEDIKKINTTEDIANKFNMILNVNNKMYKKEYNEIKIVYKIKDNKIKLFDSDFVLNNKNNCKIIFNDKEYELQEKFSIDNIENKDGKLEIILNGIKNVTNMSSMFCECDSLLELPDISNWNTSIVTNMSKLFKNCNSLLSLPDISKWDTSNVTNMSNMFDNCESLSSIPDISQWNTAQVNNMSSMFKNCKLLSSLKDIQHWDTSNVNNMSSMFENCESLSYIPDISQWNTSNITNMNSLFKNCKLLSSSLIIVIYYHLYLTSQNGILLKQLK